MHFLPTAQAISVFMVVLFLAYLTTILVPYAVRRPDPPGDPSGYDWHFFVPCRDERAVIGRTLIRLRESFPESHIWVIDDDSDDGTDAVIAGVIERYDRIHCVQRRRPYARTGKGSALNSAYRALDGFLSPDVDRSRVIVCIIDADAQLAPNAFAQVTGPGGFQDPKVGAVQIAVFMSNRGRTPHAGRTRAAGEPVRPLPRTHAGPGVPYDHRRHADAPGPYRLGRHGGQRAVHPDVGAGRHRRAVRPALARRAPRGLRAGSARAAQRPPEPLRP